ncbi:uncharacterized protein KY384_004197 [Bacidia gigantensis]|uniref:uncharacterized protein n=1 Tax=Bacidia gigantensis TaxID=2732470 RepID=UPI001D051C23|nr:uncharacterized protein KY384_004197 [Bacidia gigantensis]KAG8530840.1 hypothetical protein KY384_004197 [Bacidia gigantensis]
MNTPEEQELLSKIAVGRINRYKNSSNSDQRSDKASWNKYTAPSVLATHKSSRVVQHGKAPGGPTRPSSHRHRTLVVKNSGHTSSADDQSSQSQANASWVTKRDRHMQLINTNILDKATQARSKAMEQTRQQKAARRDQREKQKIHKFLQDDKTIWSRAAAASNVHEVAVDGLRFKVLNGGSKLFRMRGKTHYESFPCETGLKIPGDFDGNSSTPKHATIGGVTFMRSKNGNLYRSGIAKAKNCIDLRS